MQRSRGGDAQSLFIWEHEVGIKHGHDFQCVLGNVFGELAQIYTHLKHIPIGCRNEPIVLSKMAIVVRTVANLNLLSNLEVPVGLQNVLLMLIVKQCKDVLLVGTFCVVSHIVEGDQYSDFRLGVQLSGIEESPGFYEGIVVFNLSNRYLIDLRSIQLLSDQLHVLLQIRYLLEQPFDQLLVLELHDLRFEKSDWVGIVLRQGGKVLSKLAVDVVMFQSKAIGKYTSLILNDLSQTRVSFDQFVEGHETIFRDFQYRFIFLDSLFDIQPVP